MVDIPEPGDKFTEKELYAKYCVRNTGGIRPTKKNKAIILVNSVFSNTQGNYLNKTEGEFIFHVGEGKKDQVLKRNNKSLAYASERGYDALLYFDKEKQNQLEFRCRVKYEDNYQDTQTNSEGQKRKVIIFKLKMIK